MGSPVDGFSTWSSVPPVSSQPPAYAPALTSSRSSAEKMASRFTVGPPGGRSSVVGIRYIRMGFWARRGCLSAACDGLDLDEEPARQGRHLDGRARGLRVADILAIDGVHRCEVVHVGDEDRRLGDVGISEADVTEHRADVAHDLVSLLRDATFNGGVTEQTDQIMRNIGAVLGDVGLGYADI